MNPDDLVSGKIYRHKLTKEEVIYLGNNSIDSYNLRFRRKNLEEIKLDSCEIEEISKTDND